MKKLIFTILLAAVLWTVMFSPWTAPFVNFWWMMTGSALTLSVFATLFNPGWWREVKWSLPNVLLGLGIAVALWGVFWLGDKVSSWMFDFARPQVDSIYGMKEGESPWLLAALLLLLIGPAEEIFWRGYVQRTLSKRWNPNAGFAKDGKLTVGMDTSYAPAEFLAADGKTPVGFDVDIAKALAGVFGLEADPETANFDSIIPAVGAKYDIGISSFTVTKERLEAVDFVSHFNAGSAWAVKKGNPNKVDTSDLCGKKVAVQTATMQETEANKIAKQCEADGKDKLEVISSKLQTDVTTNVVTGKADVFYADSPVAGYAIAQTDGQLEMLGKVEGVAPEGIVIKKGDSQMDEAVQKAVQKLIDDGTYLKILKYWGVEDGAIETSEINTPGAE